MSYDIVIKNYTNLHNEVQKCINAQFVLKNSAILFNETLLEYKKHCVQHSYFIAEHKNTLNHHEQLMHTIHDILSDYEQHIMKFNDFLENNKTNSKINDKIDEIEQNLLLVINDKNNENLNSFDRRFLLNKTENKELLDKTFNEIMIKFDDLNTKINDINKNYFNNYDNNNNNLDHNFIVMGNISELNAKINTLDKSVNNRISCITDDLVDVKKQLNTNSYKINYAILASCATFAVMWLFKK